jgi:hypothetical protein
MKARIASIAALAAAAVLGAAAAAQAEPIPEEPARIFLKDHEDISLAESDGEVVLSAHADLWTLRSVERFSNLDEYQIVHVETGQCLTAETADGEETVPAMLAECVDAVAWTAIYDNLPRHHDFRFSTPDGYLLSISDWDAADEGAEVLAVEAEWDDSKHFQEWRLASFEDTPDPADPVSEGVPDSVSEAVPVGEDPTTAAAAQPKLPTTGGAVSAAVGAGTVALAAGTGLIVWWQRRRALRSHW